MTYDRGQGSLSKLAVILRNPITWPPGFIWDYRHPHKNAVGLSFQQWHGPKCFDDSNDDYMLALSVILGCSIADCDKLLFTHLPAGQRSYKRGLFRKIAPEMVADAIEKHIGPVKMPNPLLQVAAA